MTDFFRQQEEARGRTRLLVFLFGLSVIVVIGLTYMLYGAITLWAGNEWAPSLPLSSGIACGIIGLGSGVKMLQLSAGGSAVAKDLGGRQVDHNSRDPDERKLLNVVEEMAIASGVPVPQVWVMDQEPGINAFAAGHSPSDAVIGVTRGCMKALNRDELQGVIAHEFSHILNGDMKLNLRLIGVVHGILVIAIIGRGIMRVGAEMRGNGKNNPQMPVLALGASLFVIGYTGVLLGRLIKSAVSRQREYLADASAVQFTRNPQGIAGALMKIGGSMGSSLRTTHAEEASHMMFGSILRHAAFAFATHPPLEKRIRAILPQWDGKFVAVKISDAAVHSPAARPPAAAPPWETAGALAATSRDLVSRVGMLSPADMENAGRLRASMPDELTQFLRDPAAAQAAVFGLLIDGSNGPEELTLAAHVNADTLAIARRVAEIAAPWHSSQAIALIDIAIPALRRLTPEEYDAVKSVLDALMASDHKVDLFEFMVQTVLRRHLDRWYRIAIEPKIRYRSFAQIVPQVEVLLTAMCGVGARSPEAALMALSAGQSILAGHGVTLELSARPASLAEIGAALEHLDAATPLVKKQLLMACVAVARGDGVITGEEAELLRAIADSIGCPMPLLNAA